MLGQAVRGAAQCLLNLGLHAEDRILLRLGNKAYFPIAYLGCIAANIQPAATIQGDAIDAGTNRVITPDVLRSFYALPPAPFADG